MFENYKYTMLRYLTFLMAEVIPFNGVLYNPQKVNAGSVMAPPYDIVTPEFKEGLYNKSPYNIIRIDFGKDNEGDNDKENRYTRASGWLNEWLKKGILRQDTTPAFYCYEISYTANNEKKKLRGILGAVKIEELGSGRVYPHEMTHSKPKSDRLKILRYCNADISPIFSIYSSPERLTSSIIEKVVKEDAFIGAKNGDGFRHRLWKINDSDPINAIKKEFSDKDIFIADGHHRYETALEFRNGMAAKGLLKTGAETFNYVLMFLANMEDDGLTLLPTHRMIRTDGKIEELLKPYFKIEAITFNDTSKKEDSMQAMFDAMQNRRQCLGMFLKDKKAFYVLNFKGSLSEIDSHESLKSHGVTILHKFIFEKLFKIDSYQYEMDPGLAVDKVMNEPFQAAFFLNPTRIEDLKNVALAGQRMPPKSTYFYPKLLTGMVIYKF